MSFVPSHIRLTNSGKLPEVFLTSKVVSANDVADHHLGKLYFVLQIDSPWNSVASVGSSLINMISREYYRQEKHTPLECFEYALSKANRLLDQLERDNEKSFSHTIHALIALVVGDEIHLAFTGVAEAYYLRDGKLNRVTDDTQNEQKPGQIFGNMITGELSADDTIFLGSPGTYQALATEDLLPLLKLPLEEAGKAIARRLKQMKIRKANAIIIHFETTQGAENSSLILRTDTIYLDQQIDSTWSIVRYQAKQISTPIIHFATWLGKHLDRGARKAGQLVNKIYTQQIKPKTVDLTASAASNGSQVLAMLKNKAEPSANKFGLSFKQIIPSRLALNLPPLSSKREGGPVVNHYTSKKHRANNFTLLIQTIINIIMGTIGQLGAAIKRSPRTWYIVTALILLVAIGTSIEFRQKKETINPAVAKAMVSQMNDLAKQAKQAKIYGNNDLARTSLLELLALSEQIEADPEATKSAAILVEEANRELDTLAGATRVTVDGPLFTLTDSIQTGLIAEGRFYYSTPDGDMKSILLTGGEPTLLATIPVSSAVNQIHLDNNSDKLTLQTYDGQLYSLVGRTLTKLALAAGSFPIATGLSSFGGIVYLLDPAGSEVWKYTLSGAVATAEEYTKTNRVSLRDGISLAIDGSVFVLHKTGAVTKYGRGKQLDFKLTNLPKPYDTISDPLNFFAIEDANNYYLTDRGNDKVAPRIMEFDKNGQFVHQYFLPKEWQKKIRLIRANPKTHKAWVVVDKELYEFTLLQ